MIALDGTVFYLAMTFDNIKGILTLFVGTLAGGLVSFASPPNVQYVAETSNPPSTATPLFIAMGRPDLANGMFPFKGSIQDVAVYNVPLDLPTITNNFNLGINLPADT